MTSSNLERTFVHRYPADEKALSDSILVGFMDFRYSYAFDKYRPRLSPPFNNFSSCLMIFIRDFLDCAFSSLTFVDNAFEIASSSSKCSSDRDLLLFFVDGIGSGSAVCVA